MQAQYISRFTPRSMSPETLEAIFVQPQRFKLAERLIELIRESTQTENKHYRLLIGNRGIGKTHLISLIYHRLVKMEDLRECLMIAWLPEEAYQIDSFLGFLMAVFEALEEEYSDEYEAELQEKVERLYQVSVGEQEHQAKELLREFVGKKTLLLLIENLDMVFEGLEETGQHQLRAYLYNYKFCTILATSQSLFKEVKLKDYPFYGSFRFHHLEELSSDEAADLLANIAQLDEDEELETFLQSLTGQKRVKAVHHLAGGNPRIYIVFSGFLLRESLDELVLAFMKMLDELTPYYQDRMKSLTPRQRKIVDFLCDRRYACLLEDISQRCFLDIQSAKEELRELQAKGYLRLEEIGQERFYELQEPLLRFCLQVKKQRNKPIQLFVDFLRLWYSREELETRLSDYFELNDYFRLKEEKKDFSYGIEKEYLLYALHPIKEEIDPRVVSCQEKYQVHFEKKEFAEALQYADKLTQMRGKARDFMLQGFCLSALEEERDALFSYEKAIEINSEITESWILRGISLQILEYYDEALSSYDQAIKIDQNIIYAWVARGSVLNTIKQYDKALYSFSKAIEIDSLYYLTWYFKGNTLSNIGKYNNALYSYEKALDINPKDVNIWSMRGYALLCLEEYEKALISYDEAMKIEKNNAEIMSQRIYTLIRLKKHEESLISCKKILNINERYAKAWLLQSYTFLELKKYEEALIACDRVVNINPEHDVTWFLRGYILNNLKRYREALISSDKAIQINPDYSIFIFNRSIALLGLSRWRESVFCFDQAFEHITRNQHEISTKNVSIIVSLFINTLFESCQDVSIWKIQIATLVEILQKHQALSIFAQGLTSSIPILILSTFDRERVQLWLEIWQELTADRPEFELPLRLLAKAIEYKEKNGDPRVLLTLPIEEREILKQLLEEGSNDLKSASLNDI